MKEPFQEYSRIESMIESAYHEAALRMKLTDSELCILYMLCAREPGCPQSALYKETGMMRSTVNSSIRKMEREGVLYLTPGEGRNTKVFLTERGKELVRNTVQRMIGLENKIYESWSKEELELFFRLNLDFAEKMSAMVKEL